MLPTNNSAKEVFDSIHYTPLIVLLFETGLETEDGAPLAVSAMESLIARGDTDTVAKVLQSAADARKLAPGTSIANIIGESLTKSYCKDPFLNKYGEALSRGEGGEGPFRWVESGKANTYFDHGGGYVELRDSIKARYKAATAAYPAKHIKKLREILDATNSVSVRHKAAKGVASTKAE
jgi:hypothetical protein